MSDNPTGEANPPVPPVPQTEQAATAPAPPAAAAGSSSAQAVQPAYPQPGAAASPGYPQQGSGYGQPGYPQQAGYTQQSPYAAQQPGYPPQGPYAGQPYGQPASGAYGPAQKMNVLALVSMICGIAGLIILPFLASVAAIVMGHIAVSQLKRSQEQGKGMAITGLVLGYSGIGLWLVIVVVSFVLPLIFIAMVGATSSY